MKKALINFLKIGIPLAVGIYLIWYFYSIMDDAEKTALFQYIKSANYFWIFISLIFGLLSHISRAIRWRYMVEPLGKRIGFWNSYHAIMIGYFVNLFIPRAGEVTRPLVLSNTEKVPFPKLLGTVIAERAIDFFFLVIILFITLYYQYDNLDLILDRIDILNKQLIGNQVDEDGWSIKLIVQIILGIGVIIAGILMIFKPSLRAKIVNLIKGFIEGGLSIFKSKKPLPFILHSIFIWVMYVAMFAVCFLALPETSNMPIGGILAGFVAGTFGFIVAPGGIGVYQALVALVITTYLYPDFDKPIHSVALALSWIIWLSQNLMMLILGLISYIINIKNVTISKDENLNAATP